MEVLYSEETKSSFLNGLDNVRPSLGRVPKLHHGVASHQILSLHFQKKSQSFNFEKHNQLLEDILNVLAQRIPP